MGKPSKPWYLRILILTLCGSLYLSMWGSYLYFNAEVVHNGDKIKLREAVGNFVKSPAVQVTSSPSSPDLTSLVAVLTLVLYCRSSGVI